MFPRPTDKTSLSDALAARARATADAWHALTQAVVASLAPTEDEAGRRDAQLRLHRNGSRNSMMLMPVASLLATFAFAPWVSAPIRYGWFAVMTMVCLTLELVNRRLDKMTGRDAATVT